MVAPEETEFSGHWARLPIETRNTISASRFGFVYQVVIKAVPKESTGKGIILVSLPVDAPQGSLISTHGIKGALIQTVRVMMRPEARSRVRRIAKRLGVMK